LSFFLFSLALLPAFYGYQGEQYFFPPLAETAKGAQLTPLKI